MTRTLHVLIIMILLVSCAPTPDAPVPIFSPQPIPTVTSAPTPIPTKTPPSTVAPLPPTQTATSIPCDPFTVDYCIIDGHFLLERPIKPPGEDAVDRTYPYASTAGGTRDPHHGVEFDADFGTPIHAAADGIILYAGADDLPIYSPWSDYYGNLIVIQHEGDISTLYAHLSKIDVKAGGQIQAGDTIGEVGQSGVAIGSHLHFEVRRGNAEDFDSTVNPELWLIPRLDADGAVALSLVYVERGGSQTGITLQRYSVSGQLVETYYFDTYHPSLAVDGENAGIGDLPAGRYRVTLIYNGHLYERWVEVQSGKLTQVVIVVE